MDSIRRLDFITLTGLDLDNISICFGLKHRRDGWSSHWVYASLSVGWLVCLGRSSRFADRIDYTHQRLKTEEKL